MGELIDNGIERLVRDVLANAVVPPQERQSPIEPRWTLKRLVNWVSQNFKLNCCRETVRKALKRLDFSWKKARKLLNKASEQKRSEYLERLKPIL